MTSRNLFFKLMKEDLKSRLWAAALLSLGCFFLYPVVAAFMAGNIKEYMIYEEGIRNYSRDLTNWLSFDNGMTVFIMIVTSLVCGLSSFSYLNNKSKVDFFHGIPVRREKLYAANYINGILLLAVPYAVSMLLAVFIGISNGVEAGRLWSAASAAYGLHMTYYILMYTTVVIAAMMTGNLVVSFFGSAVFAAVVPITVTIVFGYFSTFFHTYVADAHEKSIRFFVRFSPLAEYVTQVSRYNDGKIVLPAALMALAVSAVLAVLGCFLYKKRPSEAAGRAMAFAVSRPVIRNILTVVSSLGLGLFFWMLRESTGWAVFGTVCGGVICHCVIEIIYHFDFKKLFANKGQLVVCVLFSVAVLFIFRYDLTGYDKYLPQPGRVREAAVNVTHLTNWISYGSVMEDENEGYKWKYGSTDEYVFSHMHYQDIENLLSIASEGIRMNEEDKNRSWYRDMESDSDDASEDQKKYYSSVTIVYTLSGGRRVYRNYHIYLDDVMMQMEKLYADSAYQSGTYPLMEKTADHVEAVHYRDYGEEKILDQLSREEIGELLDTYRREFASMTLSRMEEEVPVGLIRFSDEAEEAAMRWQNQSDKRRSYRFDFESYNYYPVYPSFTNTIQLLKRHKLSLTPAYEPEQISSVKICKYRYTEYDREEYEALITDPEEIKKLSEVLYNKHLLYYNPMLLDADLEISVAVKEHEKAHDYTAGIRKGKVPQFVTDRLSKTH